MGEVNKSEFKPCPFCGGEAKEHDLGNITVIRCSQCGAEQMARHRSGAVMLWQARVEPQADENFKTIYAALLEAVSRAVYDELMADATYDETVAAAKRGSQADANTILFSQTTANAAIAVMLNILPKDIDDAISRINELENENFSLAAGACIFSDGSGLTADVGGTPYCAKHQQLNELIAVLQDIAYGDPTIDDPEADAQRSCRIDKAALAKLGLNCQDEGCPHYGTPHSHPE